MGGGRSILCVPYDLAIRSIQAPTSCGQSWVFLLVVTGLALVHEVLRVEADVRIVAVLVVQPYLMMDYLARLLMTYLAQPAINGQPVVDVCTPCPLPCSCLIELFLGQHSLAPLVCA